MMTIDEAWEWYCSSRDQLNLLGRLGRKHWDNLPWDGELGRDDKLKNVESQEIIAETEFCLEHLKDFAVLILFSAFESILRETIRTAIQDQATQVQHAYVAQVLKDAVADVEHGSIFRILENLKGETTDLVEEVNQVRRYRNWVAHGRRTSRPDAVDPEAAYNRLKRFLEELDDRFRERQA